MPSSKFFVISATLIVLMFVYYLVNSSVDELSKSLELAKNSSVSLRTDTLMHLAGGLMLGLILSIFRLLGFCIGWGVIIGWEIMQGVSGTGCVELSDIIAGGATFSIIMLIVFVVTANISKSESNRNHSKRSSLSFR